MKKISTKIVLGIALCSSIIAIIVGGISISVSKKIILDKSYNYLQVSSVNQANELDSKLKLIQDKTDDLALVIKDSFKPENIKEDHKYMEEYKENIKSIIKEFAESSNINMDTYIEFNSDYSNTDVIDGILYLRNSNNQFELGTADTDIHKSTFSPKEYSWYFECVKSKKGVWGNPYIDPILKIKFLTYSTPVIINDTVVGVVGMDIKFTDFENAINDIKPYPGSYAFLINSNFDYIVHSYLQETDNMKTYNNGQFHDIASKMESEVNGIGIVSENGAQEIVGFSNLTNGYKLAIVVPQNEIMKEMNNITIIIAVIILFGIIISIAVALFIGMRISRPIREFSTLFSKVENGDLTVRSRIKAIDEIGRLSEDFNSMLNKLREFFNKTRSVCSSVAASSQEMASSCEVIHRVSEETTIAISDLAKDSLNQAEKSEKSSNEINLIIKGLNKISRDMQDSNELSEKAVATVKKGNKSVEYQEKQISESNEAYKNISYAINELSQKSQEIDEILKVIDSISKQTNLLSLNASIEAARAGEAGKGFAIVADEVKKLAKQSEKSVKEIALIINEVHKGVNITVSEVQKSAVLIKQQDEAFGETMQVFAEITTIVEKIADHINNTASAANLLNENVNKAGTNIEYMNELSKRTASVSEELSASAEEQTATAQEIAQASGVLAQIANELQLNIEKFNV